MPNDLMLEQLHLETCAVEEGVTAYYKQLDNGGMMPPHVHLLKLGLGPLTEAITGFQTSKAACYHGSIKTVIQDIPPVELAYLTLWHLFSSVPDRGSLQRAVKTLGRELIDHLEFRRFRLAHPAFAKSVQTRTKSRHRGHIRSVMLLAKHRAGLEDLKLEKNIEYRLGSTFLHLCEQSTGLFRQGIAEVNQHGTETPAIIEYTPEVAQWLQKAHHYCAFMSPKFHVCVVPPRDWTDVTEGGFHSGCGSLKLPVIRTTSQEHLSQTKQCGLERLFTLVNRLQQVPWRVNKSVLQVLEEVWRIPGRLGVLAQETEIELPAKQWSTSDEWKQFKTEHPEEAREWKRKARDAYAARAKAQGQLISLTNITGRARLYKKYPRFYYVWTMDYRGRVYPVQSHLTPQGSDLSKGLLEFADGKPLGERGLYWLKLRITGCYQNGIEKKSYAERLLWFHQYEEAILDSGRYPLDGMRMWTLAEEPWQFLAAAMDYAGYVDSGQGVSYVSHLPIAVDGSCNGLQHLSALMGDAEAAWHVNMLPCDEPQDIYSRVTERVVALVNQDISSEEQWKDSGLTIGQLASLWQGNVTRKIVKRPVMTIPYGVTAIGMRDQIAVELEKQGASRDLMGFHQTAYLVSRIQVAIGDIIGAARQCMEWIRTCAMGFNKIDQLFSWVSPVGLYVTQNYHKFKDVNIMTYWGKQRVHFVKQTEGERIDKQKQVGGSSPNLIHSLDASHLCMTVERCWDNGLRYFAMVHDSYGCHASDVDLLADCLRKAFVELYSVPRLQELRQQWMSVLPEKYHEEFLKEPPCVNTLRLDELHKAQYFFHI